VVECQKTKKDLSPETTVRKFALLIVEIANSGKKLKKK